MGTACQTSLPFFLVKVVRQPKTHGLVCVVVHWMMLLVLPLLVPLGLGLSQSALVQLVLLQLEL